MKILSFVVFLIAIQAIISFSITAVNSVQRVGSSVISVSVPTENTVSQLVTDGEQVAQLFTNGGNTGGILAQEKLKRF